MDLNEDDLLMDDGGEIETGEPAEESEDDELDLMGMHKVDEEDELADFAT